jgi:hypothetical protein
VEARGDLSLTFTVKAWVEFLEIKLTSMCSLHL